MLLSTLCQCCVGSNSGSTDEVITQQPLKSFNVDFGDGDIYPEDTSPNSPDISESGAVIDDIAARADRDYWKSEIKSFVKKAIDGVGCFVYDLNTRILVPVTLKVDPSLSLLRLVESAPCRRVEEVSILRICGMKYGTLEEELMEKTAMELGPKMGDSVLIFYKPVGQSQRKGPIKSTRFQLQPVEDKFPFSQELKTDGQRGLFILMANQKERQRLFVSIFVLTQICKKKKSS